VGQPPQGAAPAIGSILSVSLGRVENGVYKAEPYSRVVVSSKGSVGDIRTTGVAVGAGACAAGHVIACATLLGATIPLGASTATPAAVAAGPPYSNSSIATPSQA